MELSFYLFLAFVWWILMLVLLYPYKSCLAMKMWFWGINLALPFFGIFIWWYIIKH